MLNWSYSLHSVLCYAPIKCVFSCLHLWFLVPLKEGNPPCWLPSSPWASYLLTRWTAPTGPCSIAWEVTHQLYHFNRPLWLVGWIETARNDSSVLWPNRLFLSAAVSVHRCKGFWIISGSVPEQACILTNSFFSLSGEAESIMESERDRLNLPQGLPTFESIEKARRAKSGLMSILEKWCNCGNATRNRPAVRTTFISINAFFCGRCWSLHRGSGMIQ